MAQFPAAKRPRLATLIGVCGFFALAGSLVPMLTPTGDEAPAPASPEPAAAPSPELTPPMASFLGWTAALCVVLGVCVWLVRRRNKSLTLNDDGQVRVLAGLPVGNRCALYLVQAADQQLLVGVDTAGVKSVLPLPNLPDAAPPDVGERSVSVLA